MVNLAIFFYSRYFALLLIVKNNYYESNVLFQVTIGISVIQNQHHVSEL